MHATVVTPDDSVFGSIVRQSAQNQ